LHIEASDIPGLFFWGLAVDDDGRFFMILYRFSVGGVLGMGLYLRVGGGGFFISQSQKLNAGLVLHF